MTQLRKAVLTECLRIKSRMANMLHLRFLGRGSRQRNAIAWRRSVAAIGLESKKSLSGIASCALTMSPISWCSSCRSCNISSEAGVACCRGASAVRTHWLLKNAKLTTPASITAVRRFHGTAANERRASDLCGEADQTSRVLLWFCDAAV